jgi:hypothetical protein
MVRDGTVTINEEDRMLSGHTIEKMFLLVFNAEIPAAWGYAALFVSVLAFGSNSLPIKKFNIRDGFFYQLNVCCSIFAVGLVVNCFRFFPRFYFLPMVGGFCWCTASMLTIPSIKIIGESWVYVIKRLRKIMKRFFPCKAWESAI